MAYRFSDKIAHGDGRVAQLVEHLTFNQVVPGSSPGALTNNFNDLSQIDGSGQNLRVCAVSATALLGHNVRFRRARDRSYPPHVLDLKTVERVSDDFSVCCSKCGRRDFYRIKDIKTLRQ